MTTIDAPRIAGRERALRDLEGVPLGPSTVVTVRFPERAAVTPSYVDELIASVCKKGGATLNLVALPERGKTLARESAASLGVISLLRILE